MTHSTSIKLKAALGWHFSCCPRTAIKARFAVSDNSVSKDVSNATFAQVEVAILLVKIQELIQTTDEDETMYVFGKNGIKIIL
jgi:hypothetical protein